jgi:hypothetical protein
MSEEEFLARWSRRKAEARTAVDAPQPLPEPVDVSNSALPGSSENVDDPEFDLSSLPPIESITGATDVTAFLRKGIPAELSRAALRRAWSADPAIRDFIGLAENAWDFNDPNAMPGFGPLDCSEEQLAALLDRVVGGVRTAADSLATVVPQTAIPEQTITRQSADSNIAKLSEQAPDAIDDPGRAQEISSDEVRPISAAVQPDTVRNVEDAQTSGRRRKHGSALPR